MAKKPKVLDPSRTTTLRQQYMAEIRNRTKALKGAINKWLVEEDNLGLKPRSPSNIFKSNKVFEFSTDPDKLDGFKKWFQGQVDEGILGVDVPGPAWHSKYVDSSYRKGAARAYIDTHKEDLAPSADFFAGSKAQFIQQAFAAPETLSKIQLIYTRQFDRLKGFTDQMASETSRLLAEGLSNGLHPSTIARNMNKAIDKLTKTRALTIARTEVIHAHAEGQLDSFDALGVEEVGIKAEWVTAGDDRVCAQCAAMEGKVMMVKEARGLIPLHPNCRCAWIPATVEMKKAKPKVKVKPKAKRKVKAKPKVKNIGNISSDPKLKGKPNFDDGQLNTISSPEYKWLNPAGASPEDKFTILPLERKERRLKAAKDLSLRSKLSQSDVLRLMDLWGDTSNGHDYTMLLMQERAAKKFGGKLSKWQQSRIDDVRKARRLAIESGTPTRRSNWATSFEDVTKDGYKLKSGLPGASLEDNIDLFLDAMYEATQKSLENAGMKTVRVWRGAIGQIDNKYKALIESGKAVPIKGNALESWSISRDAASKFANSVDGMLMAVDVPAERVLSSSLTGIGTSRELEVVLIQGVEDLVKMEIGL